MGYGKLYIANVSRSLHQFCARADGAGRLQPDLPFRLRENIPLNVPDPTTFYSIKESQGYTTYPFSEEYLKLQTEKA